jgi:imidazole glycerol-phosphate synthase subunit HisH
VIAIIDYGMGNLGSIANMLKKIGNRAVLTSDPAEIRSASKLILPGVGAFDHGMRCLQERGLVSLLNELVLDEKKPVLGMCLGMQLFASSSEEGEMNGLGWIKGRCVRFYPTPEFPKLKVPNMGWDYPSIKRDSPIVRGFDAPPRFYFVNSYHLRCDDADDIIATTSYGVEATAVVGRGNIVGTQFHPEKSHRFGMQLLRNFVEEFPE